MPRRSKGVPITIPGWVGGLIENVDANNAPPGTLEESVNFTPTPGG